MYCLCAVQKYVCGREKTSKQSVIKRLHEIIEIKKFPSFRGGGGGLVESWIFPGVVRILLPCNYEDKIYNVTNLAGYTMQ